MAGSYSSNNMPENHMYQPMSVTPIAIPSDVFTLETIDIIQAQVGRSLKQHNIPSEPDTIIFPEKHVVIQVMDQHANKLYPFWDRNKLIRRTVKTIVDDTLEKYYDIMIETQQFKGSVSDVNIERIRRRLPKKIRAYADIS